MLDAEVVVVGGGPAGCATALGLARRGHDVLVLDRALSPRTKVCGEGLMPVGVAELKRLGLHDVVEGRPFLGIHYIVGSAEARGRFPEGRTGIGLRRGRLEGALVAAVRREGVRVRRGVGVTGLASGGRHRIVSTTKGDLRCRLVVGADGLRSSVRKRAGLQRPARGRRRFGVRRHVRVDAERVPDVVQVHVLGGLEVYITPVGPNEVNLAVLLEKEGMRTMKGDLAGGVDRILSSEPRLAWWAGCAHDGPTEAIGPLRQEATSVVADGVVLVGDAAGFLDGITGEGMSLTLVSARLAADAVSRALRAGDVRARALRPYALRRAWAARRLTWMTEVVLAGIRHRRLAEHVVAGLARNPEVFDRVLAISAGGRFRDVGLRGLARVLRS